MPRHPNKHIQAAIEYAVSLGWRVEKASGHAHIWGFIMCPACNARRSAATTSIQLREYPRTTRARYACTWMLVRINRIMVEANYELRI